LRDIGEGYCGEERMKEKDMLRAISKEGICKR